MQTYDIMQLFNDISEFIVHLSVPTVLQWEKKGPILVFLQLTLKKWVKVNSDGTIGKIDPDFLFKLCSTKTLSLIVTEMEDFEKLKICILNIQSHITR